MEEIQDFCSDWEIGSIVHVKLNFNWILKYTLSQCISAWSEIVINWKVLAAMWNRHRVQNYAEGHTALLWSRLWVKSHRYYSLCCHADSSILVKTLLAINIWNFLVPFYFIPPFNLSHQKVSLDKKTLL